MFGFRARGQWVLAGLGLAAWGAAAELPRISGGRVDTAPTIDGVLAEGEWAQAKQATNFIDRVTGKAAPDQTTAWIGYDDQAIYVGFKCSDPEPGRIVGRAIQPGSDMDGEDLVAVVVNPYNTRTRSGASQFVVNPLGTQDEEIEGGRAGKREWRGEWQAAAKVVADGWVAEMRIPWTVLNLPAGENLTMDLNFARQQQRTNILSFWSDLTQQDRYEYMGYWDDVSPPKGGGKRLSFLAYAAPELSNEEDEDRFSFRAGLDARYLFTPQLTGLLSINPDFRNIEQQVTGIEFTRSERFYNDSRPFFTEGSDYFFLTPPYTFGRMFYSRRIEDFDVGAKFFGRLTKRTGVGALVTREGTDRTDSVVNLSQEWGPRHDSALFATMTDQRGSQNLMVGGRHSSGFGNYFVEGEYAAVDDNGEESKAFAVAAGYSVPKFFGVVRYMSTDEQFNPSLGLVPFTNRRGAYFFGEYNSEYRSGAFKDAHAYLDLGTFETHQDRLHDRGANVGFNWATKSDIRFGFDLGVGNWFHEHERNASLFVSLNNSNPQKQLTGWYGSGMRGDDRSRGWGLDGRYRVFKSVDLGLRYVREEFRGNQSQVVATIGWEIDRRRALSARSVWTNGVNNWYIAYRNSGFTGTEWYFILGDPNSDAFTERASLKVVWAF